MSRTHAGPTYRWTLTFPRVRECVITEDVVDAARVAHADGRHGDPSDRALRSDWATGCPQCAMLDGAEVRRCEPVKIS